jgi:hypothetical protein
MYRSISHLIPRVFILLILLGLQQAWTESARLWELVVPSTGSEVVAGASTLLEKELAARMPALSLMRTSMVTPGVPAILLGTPESSPDLAAALPTNLALPERPEGYAIWTETGAGVPRVFCLGVDQRGVLFAAAHVLRSIDFSAVDPALPVIAPVASAPVVPLRGHQMGYGNMNNTIDAWDMDAFDQYIRDLIVFGTNAIELSPTINPKARESVHMDSTMWDRNIALSELIHSYGLEVWLWMSVQQDLTDTALGGETRAAWARLFTAMPHVDQVFVAGGDPGSNEPGLLMNWLAESAPALQGPHPGVRFWVSNQGFEPEENDTFFAYLQERRPEWFAGAAFGPWAKISIQEMRERTPAQYPIRRYPDITHSVRCQYPVPEWDPAFAQTLGRESFNARPVAMKQIHNLFMPFADGFVAYSEGVHDDVNKMLWSQYGWNPDADPADVLAEYGRYFIGGKHGETVAKGLMALEDNWFGPIADNTSIAPTAALWRAMAAEGGNDLKHNWRFQMIYLRALYDDYVQKRAAAEKAGEEAAVATLRADLVGDLPAAIKAAQNSFRHSGKHPDLAPLRKELDKFGPALFKLIGIQLDVKRFHAMNPERGAILEFLDTPLNNRDWWEAELEKVAASLKDGRLDEAAARSRILELCDWDQNPAGGFYDDLGRVGRQPHLVVDKTSAQDPGGVSTAMVEFMRPAEGWRMSWADQAQTLFGAPLKMHYEGLDPGKAYTLRVVYAGRFKATMTLRADGTHEIHGPVSQSDPIAPQEYAIPREATSDGMLELQWDLVEGRGCQVAEVWLYPAE